MTYSPTNCSRSPQTLNMGSSCSILNDTGHDVWITHAINWKVLIASVEVVSALLTTGMHVAAIAASAGEEGALSGGRASIMAEGGEIKGETETTFAGLTATQWTTTRKITSLSVADLSRTLHISREEAEKLQNDVKEFQASAELIKPGEKYTWSGTLSLTMTVYVMNHKLQSQNRACFTGPTHDSENIYPISKYFTNLDVT